LKLSITFALLTLFVLSVNAHAQNNQAADEAALREAVKQLETGWNTKNAATYAKVFAEDADFVVITGTYVKGRADIEAGHRQIFATIFKDTKVTLNVERIRFLRPDVAVVHAKGRREGPTKELTVDAMITLVLTKETQGWTIAAFQNTRIAPPAQ
jgi:uncharacterized protein (TIGR02246 family)